MILLLDPYPLWRGFTIFFLHLRTSRILLKLIKRFIYSNSKKLKITFNLNFKRIYSICKRNYLLIWNKIYNNSEIYNYNLITIFINISIPKKFIRIKTLLIKFSNYCSRDHEGDTLSFRPA